MAVLFLCYRLILPRCNFLLSLWPRPFGLTPASLVAGVTIFFFCTVIDTVGRHRPRPAPGRLALPVPFRPHPWGLIRSFSAVVSLGFLVWWSLVFGFRFAALPLLRAAVVVVAWGCGAGCGQPPPVCMGLRQSLQRLRPARAFAVDVASISAGSPSPLPLSLLCTPAPLALRFLPLSVWRGSFAGFWRGLGVAALVPFCALSGRKK